MRWVLAACSRSVQATKTRNHPTIIGIHIERSALLLSSASYPCNRR